MRPPRSRWGDLRIRVISAVILGPSALVLLWLGGWFWNALIVAVALGLAWEWSALVRGRSGWLLTWFGAPYIAVPTVALIWLRADGAVGRWNVLFIVLVVWASDIGAYVAGRMIGGAKLAPTISPGKTRSGAVGALFAAMLIGVAVAAGTGSAVHAAMVALVFSVVEQAGDLFESWIKRLVGVKDSGRVIPGHGGLFDRLDGLLAAAPVAALLAANLGRGVELWR